VRDLIGTVEGAPQAEPHLLDAVLTTAEMELRYEGYLEKERVCAETLRRQADFPLPEALPYPELLSLSFEARQKLDRIRPATLAQAARIPGVSPSDLQNLVMEVRKRRDRIAAAVTADEG
jgi:tRNA uridine 5-carboxymethylaminomethyl modification enzyme